LHIIEFRKGQEVIRRVGRSVISLPDRDHRKKQAGLRGDQADKFQRRVNKGSPAGADRFIPDSMAPSTAPGQKKHWSTPEETD